MFDFSLMGQRLGGPSGISELMDDLGHALAQGGAEVKMLGGGQPAHIPAVDERWASRFQEMLENREEFDKAVGNYDPPRGNPAFIAALAAMLRRECGWDVGPEHIAITAGGQTAFFFLFHLLGGEMPDGTHKKILLPLVPEYIGYANQSVRDDLFRAHLPRIEFTGEHEFKYRVDFDTLEIGDDIAAICVSRPTNPTGNVLTDEEIARLADLAKAHNIPLIIDNAYGAPFPNIIFTETTPVWHEHMILTLSLSKIGLPGTRTGIVIAHPQVAAAIANMSAIVGLANPNVGQAMVRPMLESGEILKLSNEVVRPFYIEKSRFARKCVQDTFGDRFRYYVHRSEGALFLWLWFPDLPISSKELYQRLKKRGVLIISGHYFFFGLDDAVDWPHRQQCLRMTFTMSGDVVAEGIRVIGEEVARAHAEAAEGKVP
jgi:valine--pyruvate aminotransferase